MVQGSVVLWNMKHSCAIALRSPPSIQLYQMCSLLAWLTTLPKQWVRGYPQSVLTLPSSSAFDDSMDASFLSRKIENSHDISLIRTYPVAVLSLETSTDHVLSISFCFLVSPVSARTTCCGWELAQSQYFREFSLLECACKKMCPRFERSDFSLPMGRLQCINTSVFLDSPKGWEVWLGMEGPKTWKSSFSVWDDPTQQRLVPA